MPENLRALIVIIFITGIILMIAKPAFADFVSGSDFKRRSSLWIVLTLIFFVFHNFWVFAIGASIAILIAKPKEKNILALYFMLLFVAPPIDVRIPALGVFNHLFLINYYRLLALVILLPAAIHLSAKRNESWFGSTTADKLVIVFAVFTAVLRFRGTTFTDGLREVLYAYTDMVLPYYVFSRGLQNLKAYNEVAAQFTIASALLAIVAIFEYVKHWLLYKAVTYAIDPTYSYGHYLTRGGSLRALASAGNPISLGFVLMVALGFCLYLRRFNSSEKLKMDGLIIVLAGGLIAALSRGPWVGAAVFIVIYQLFSGAALGNAMKLLLGSIMAVLLVSVLPFGDKIINLIPFIGHVGSNNVAYRELMFHAALTVSLQHPWVGSSDFLDSPIMQAAANGSGLIDVVNTYLELILNYGYVGLVLFAALFGSIIYDLFRSSRQIKETHQDVFLLGVAIFAILISIAVTIATTSSVTTIPVVYWAVVGMGAGYIQMVRRGQFGD